MEPIPYMDKVTKHLGLNRMQALRENLLGLFLYDKKHSNKMNHNKIVLYTRS